MEKKYLALFDLDGTLFDTGEVNYYAYKYALSPYGIDLDKSFFLNECNGRHYTEFLPRIMKSTDFIETVHFNKKNAYANNLNKAKCNKHLFEIISSIKDKYHLAIVTTASEKNARDILEYFGYIELFELIISQENITRVKPDPQGYEIAMEYFNIDASRTIIFEDSEVGILAARATGASVFVVDQI